MTERAKPEYKIVLPRQALVVLAGPSACGKSTFAARHFLPTQVVSSDQMRALISDDEADQSVSGMAFELLHDLVSKRLAGGRLTVVDSTALRVQARRDLVKIGRRYNTPVILILLRADRALCLERDARRARQVGPAVIDQQLARLEETLARARGEGFDRVYILNPSEADRVRIFYEPLPGERANLAGPFDIIGDIHGCADELQELLGRLGYAPDAAGIWRHAQGRRFVSLGDLTDRGPNSVEVLRIVTRAVGAGAALYTPGNHCNKLLRYLQGHRVKVAHGLQQTVTQIDALPADERQALLTETIRLIDTAPPYLVLDERRLVVAHAGIKEWMIGEMSRRIRDFTLYGDVSGEVDEQGHPIRRDWAADYRGSHAIVYGHTVVPEAVWRNNTINIDQGCVFGGCLTALRWPERETVQVAAHAVYDTRDTPDLGSSSAA
jgi:protein phosphatase